MHDLSDAGGAATYTVRWSDYLLLVRWVGPLTIHRPCRQ
jgi:hypothetical protein